MNKFLGFLVFIFLTLAFGCTAQTPLVTDNRPTARSDKEIIEIVKQNQFRPENEPFKSLIEKQKSRFVRVLTLIRKHGIDVDESVGAPESSIRLRSAYALCFLGHQYEVNLKHITDHFVEGEIPREARNRTDAMKYIGMLLEKRDPKLISVVFENVPLSDAGLSMEIQGILWSQLVKKERKFLILLSQQDEKIRKGSIELLSYEQPYLPKKQRARLYAFLSNSSKDPQTRTIATRLLTALGKGNETTLES